MKVYEFIVAQTAVSHGGGPFVQQERLTWWIPEEAQEALEPVLTPYGQHPEWYFDKINWGRPPAPWAVACLDREYELAGHIATTRPPDAGIYFCPYYQVPAEPPEEFIPGVGALLFHRKSGLEQAASSSPVFQAVWETLANYPEQRRWLVLMDPLPGEWVETASRENRELWLENRP